jgi:hypothetical protein
MTGPIERDDAVRHALGEALAGDVAAIATAGRAVLVDEREVDAVLQAQAVHGLIRNDAAMPARLRSMLVAYAGRLLDEARPIVLTPEAIAALERRPR